MDFITAAEVATLSMVAAAVSAFLQDLKPFLKRFAVFKGDDAPWGLVIKVIDMIVTVFLWLGDLLPSISNPFEAVGVGFLTAFASQKVYDEVKKPKPEDKEDVPPLPYTLPPMENLLENKDKET